MSGILVPGYLKWDGTKYVIDPTPAGPTGPTGPAGPAGATGATGATGDVNRWKALIPTRDFDEAVITSTTITMNSDQTENIFAGNPVRVIDIVGVPLRDVPLRDAAPITTYETITGIREEILDSRGRLYFEIVELFGQHMVNIYNRSSMSSRFLVAHTASFIFAGSHALIEDNRSGLGGLVRLHSIVDTDWTVEFYKWGIVKKITDNALTWDGPPLSTGTYSRDGYLKAVWYGLPEMTDCITCVLSHPDVTFSSRYSPDYEKNLRFSFRNTLGNIRVCKLFLDGGYFDDETYIVNVYAGFEGDLIVSAEGYESLTVDNINYALGYGEHVEFVLASDYTGTPPGATSGIGYVNCTLGIVFE